MLPVTDAMGLGPKEQVGIFIQFLMAIHLLLCLS